MGRTNVGKSTLVNALVGQKIAAVSPRPQTTRKRQMGILSLENAQAIFVDTPGLHQPRHKLGENMNQEALETLESCDLVLFVADLSQPPTDEDRLLAGHLAQLKRKAQVLVALNKVDLLSAEDLPQRQAEFLDLLPTTMAHFPVSALQGNGLTDLLKVILECLPEGEPFFPEGQVTDLYERELASDLIREAALIILRDEVPHGIAVRVDEFTERGETGAFIAATIFVERESHKPILIGQKGDMLKKIGTRARIEIESMSDRKVFLQLRVKVRKNWRDDEQVLRGFGYGQKKH